MIDYVRRLMIVIIMAVCITLLFIGGTIGHAIGKMEKKEAINNQTVYYPYKQSLGFHC